tara:strand:+ start:106 stop:1386 length:1281 start_codon:yes stop_codon:yes gene_type:complete
MKFIYNFISSILKKTSLETSLKKDYVVNLSNKPDQAIESVLNATGEVSSLVYSEHILSLFAEFDDQQKMEFFTILLNKYDLNSSELIDSINEYQATPSQKGMASVLALSHPQWDKLFKRMNSTSDGTVKLVHLREDLLKMRKNHPELGRLDVSLLDMFKTLFNPGYLVMEPIDWNTPANILEKIIAYEAVHEISSWEELRSRLEPEDRKCFAFFHLAMPEEPLIFVEVALTESIPDSIQNVLSSERNIIPHSKSTTAVFYSISNCQNGLVGVSFGNFLLKQVIGQLKEEIPTLSNFVTLSPVPGFMKWLEKNDTESFNRYSQFSLEKTSSKHKDHLYELMAKYLLVSDRPDQLPNDPVARFHLGNGASVERFNFMGDVSERGMKQSSGMMVNYLYDIDLLEKYHEDYSRNQEIHASDTIKNILKVS